VARVFRVMQGKQLVNRRGETVAGGGELVPIDHPALKEHKDPAQIGHFVDVEPPKAEPVAATKPNDSTVSSFQDDDAS
jgi:hypothetical protein